MQRTDIAALPIAVRVFPKPPETEKRSSKTQKRWHRPDAMFVFDTETRIDATQSVIFGSYRYVVKGNCLEEGLFYADDASDAERKILEKYVLEHPADVVKGASPGLLLLTRKEFLEKLYRAVYKGRCLLVGFNLPFDIARIAYDVAPARGRFAGGFSFGLWSYIDKFGCEHRNQHRPRVGIKHIDNKRALKGFTARNKPDRVDLVPENSLTGVPETGYVFRGHFLDLRTLAFAQTDKGYTLETACKAFGIEHGKIKTAVHGIVTEEYIDYNRRDVQATCELAIKLLEEYDRNPIKLQATKAYSPASIGKAYLRAMGIKPILQRQPDFPRHLLGYAQSAFFGGRTSAHIRKFPIPVVYTDFISMYPTVNNLMNLWRFVTAKEIRCVEHCTEEIADFLRRVKVDDLFNSDTWKRLTAFVKVIPNGDILPHRAKYSTESNDWQVGVNHLYAGDEKSGRHSLWFSLPDVVASVLLTGSVPEIIDAFRIEPVGVLPGLKSVRLRGQVRVDPANEDFFKLVIEQRKSLSKRTDLSPDERERLDKALKVLANSTSYGIYAEMNRKESEERVRVTCHGIDAEPYHCTVVHPEAPGEYCFPPMASLITGAARLMLALLEQSVKELGGTYAMEDTDSMAIVATETGGTIPCPGGRLRTSDGQPGISALSWNQVKGICDRFAALNPYCRDVVAGSILKLEDVNFEPAPGEQRQLYCVAISAKRYALFIKDGKGRPHLLEKGTNSSSNGWKEHGLGHLLNPSDPEAEDRDWTAQAWLNIVRRSLGLKTIDLPFARVPAVGRVTVSSPAVMNPLIGFNTGKQYRDQIKPFNFLLTVQTIRFGHPTGVDPNRFHLIAPYETDPNKWSKLKWIDQYSGNHYRITTSRPHGDRATARVKTYGDVLEEYEYHPESKCADANGNPCSKETVGLLRRRHVKIDQIVYIGKESNRLEDVETGMVQDGASVYTEYSDPRRDEWETWIRPRICQHSLAWLCRNAPFSRRSLIEWRAGRSRPHPQNEKLLKQIVQKSIDAESAKIREPLAHLIGRFDE